MKDERLNKKEGGFTLIELIIVVIILALIAAIVFGAFSNYRNNQAVDANSQIILSALQEARQNTLDSLNSSQYGVNFSSTTASIFSGTSLASGVLQREYNLIKPVQIIDLDLSGGGSEIVFERLTGQTDDAGLIRVGISGDDDHYRDIIIEETGISYVE